jgi:hypothetical protein
MIGMFLLQDRKVWNFYFGYFDLFVIWFLAIGISDARIGYSGPHPRPARRKRWTVE